MYGTYWQFKRGDAKNYYENNPDEKPKFYDVQGTIMKDAWSNYEGWGYDEAIIEYMNTCKTILERNGISTEDPQK